jgi:hypothetical protein
MVLNRVRFTLRHYKNLILFGISLVVFLGALPVHKLSMGDFKATGLHRRLEIGASEVIVASVHVP